MCTNPTQVIHLMSRGIDHRKDLSLLTQTCRTPKGRPPNELRDTQVISDFDCRVTKKTVWDTLILTILILIIRARPGVYIRKTLYACTPYIYGVYAFVVYFGQKRLKIYAGIRYAEAYTVI